MHFWELIESVGKVLAGDFQFNICQAKANIWIEQESSMQSILAGVYSNFRWLKPKILIPFPLPDEILFVAWILCWP